MKASKALASLMAAAAVVGSIGLAYAQTTTTTPDTTTPSATPTAPAAPGNQGATTTTPSAMPTTTERAAGMQTERPAQADRN